MLHRVQHGVEKHLHLHVVARDTLASFCRHLLFAWETQYSQFDNKLKSLLANPQAWHTNPLKLSQVLNDLQIAFYMLDGVLATGNTGGTLPPKARFPADTQRVLNRLARNRRVWWPSLILFAGANTALQSVRPAWQESMRRLHHVARHASQRLWPSKTANNVTRWWSFQVHTQVSMFRTVIVVS